MKLNKQKVHIQMAKACLNTLELCKQAGIQYETLRRILNGSNARPATIGKIAKALNAKVEELLED